MKLNYTLCDFSECPLKDKCARYLPNLDRSNTTHFGEYPYNENRKRCGYFEPYDDVQVDEKVLNNILDRIKSMQDANNDN